MKRMLWYDRTTGEVVHSHYEVHAVESEDAHARLTAPAATEADDALVELASRGLDLDHAGTTTTDAEPQSSRSIHRWVDVKSGRLRSRRIEIADAADRTQED